MSHDWTKHRDFHAEAATKDVARRLIGALHQPRGSNPIYTADQLDQLAPHLNRLCGDVGRAKSPLRIVLAPLASDNTRFWLVESLLATTLQRRGHEVRFLLCDRAKSNCSFLVESSTSDWTRQCYQCWHRYSRRYSRTGLPVMRVSKLSESHATRLPCSDQDEMLARSALLRQLQRGTLDDIDPDDAQLQSFRDTVKAFGGVAKTLIEQRVERLICPDGLYEGFGKLLLDLTAADIPVLTHARGRRKRCEAFAWNRPVSEWFLDPAWESLKNRELTPFEQDQIDRYLLSRVEQSGEVAVYSFGSKQDAHSIRARMGVPAEMPLDTMYPNLLWDANTVDRDRIFEGQIQWVQRTIDWYLKQSKRFLCIKAHPAETVRGSRQSIADVAADRLGNAESPMVKVIRPDEDFHSHSVMQASDRGIVYTSTVGLEMAAMGKPVIVCARSHFAGKGFTSEPDSLDQYIDSLANFITPLSSETRRMAERYFYLWAMGSQIPWNFHNEIAMGHVGQIATSQLDQFGHDPSIQAIVESIECDPRGPLILPPATSSTDPVTS